MAELIEHHRSEQGEPITCGAPHGCVTAVVKDVQCAACLDELKVCRLCREATAVGPCCSAHGDKPLCHRCYRRWHFVEICVPGCSGCAAEGLDPDKAVAR